ncbi:hypothetical protein Tco_1479796, partial [Tanacetum coccineum]
FINFLRKFSNTRPFTWNSEESAILERKDPTYNGVQFKLYETEPLNREGGLVKFETTKWIPPEISAKIRVLMSVHGELMIIRKCKSSPEDLLDPHIASVEGYISGLKDSVHSIEGIAGKRPSIHTCLTSLLY